MTDLVSPLAAAYAEEHSTPEPLYLAGVYERTRASFGAWGMMVGRSEGRLLEMLVFGTGATRVLEIGTFTGYSALSMAAGLGPEGTVVTLEANPDHAAVARENVASSPHGGRIEIIEGPAIESLARLEGPFDVVFIDADKSGYDDYFEAVLPKLAPRGLIVCDNTLFHGEVLPGEQAGPDATALRKFNDARARDPRVVCAFTTIRDGVTIMRPVGG